MTTRQRHLRSRDVPHPGRERRWGDPTDSGPPGRGAKRPAVPNPGRRTFAERVEGANGDWPAMRRIGEKNLPHPHRPAILFLYDDIGEVELPVPVFGMFPASLISKLLPWLRCDRREVLHVCSGALPPGEGIRVDVRRDARPDILADGRALPLRDGSVAAVLIDPPYTEHYARDLYGTNYPRPSHLLAEAARVVRSGGRVAIVHYITPNPPAGTRLVKVFGLSTGFGFPMRAVTIYERDHARLPGVG